MAKNLTLKILAVPVVSLASLVSLIGCSKGDDNKGDDNVTLKDGKGEVYFIRTKTESGYTTWERDIAQRSKEQIASDLEYDRKVQQDPELIAYWKDYDLRREDQKRQSMNAERAGGNDSGIASALIIGYLFGRGSFK